MVLSRMVKPVSATVVPTLRTLPRKVPTLVSSTPAWASGDGAGVRYSAGDAARPEGGDNGDVDAPVAGNNLSGAAVDDAAEKSPNIGQVDAR